jgi:hypothetical protein
VFGNSDLEFGICLEFGVWDLNLAAMSSLAYSVGAQTRVSTSGCSTINRNPDRNLDRCRFPSSSRSLSRSSSILQAKIGTKIATTMKTDEDRDNDRDDD